MHSWQKRALDPDSPTTKDNETVRTTSSEYRGKEILYPTIRMIDGKLKKLSDEEAKQYALVNRDYKEFVSPNQAEAWSKSFSNLIDSNRKDNMPMTQQQAAQVLRRNAPPGEFPAFINPQEAKVLKSMGGAGKKTKSGLRSYFLSGLLGGGGQGTQTSTSKVELDPEVKRMRDKTFSMAEQAAAQPYQKYEGQRFAKAGEDTLASRDQIRGMQGQGQEAFGQAAGVGQDVSGYNAQNVGKQSWLEGNKIEDYMAPQRTAVLDEIGRRGREGIRKSINELQGQHNKVAGGSFHSRGDLRDATAIAEGQKNITAAETQYLDKIFADAAARKQGDMSMDQQRQLAGADRDLAAQDVRLRGAQQQMAGTQAGRQAGVQDAQLLSQVGSDIENRQQNQLDFDYDEFVGERDHLKNQAGFMSNIVAAAPGGQTGTTTNPYSKGNKVTQALGAGLSAYAADPTNPWLAGGAAGLALLG